MSAGITLTTQQEALLELADEIGSLETPMGDGLSQDCCGARLIMRAGKMGGTVESVFGMNESQLSRAIMLNKSIAPDSRNHTMANHLRNLVHSRVED